eukprot:5934797-Prymnesium_polylepis.1
MAKRNLRDGNTRCHTRPLSKMTSVPARGGTSISSLPPPEPSPPARSGSRPSVPPSSARQSGLL